MKIRVATFNIQYGLMVGLQYKILAKDILNSEADVVALQEVDMNTERNHRQNTMEQLSAYTGMQYYSYAPALKNFQGGQYGVAVLSKYPILSAYYEQLPKTTEREEERTFLHVVVDVKGFSLDLFTTHSEGGSIVEQLAVIQKHTASCENYVVLGDFNCENYSRFEVFPNTTLVNNTENPLVTTMNHHSYDNIVVSRKIVISGCHTVDTEHTDHYMLLADLVLPQK